MRIRAGGIVRHLIGMACVLVLAGAARSQKVIEIEPGLFSTQELKASLASTPHKRILVRSAAALSGDIKIQTAEGASVTLVYRIQARTDSRKKGTDYIDLISVSLSAVADEVRIEMRAPNPAPWEEDADAGLVLADLTVPPNCAIDIDAVAFDVAAVGPFKEIIIPSSMGRLDIANVTTKLDVATANQRVSLQNIKGDISASTTNAKLSARSIDCTDKAAKLRNESGDIVVDAVVGELNIRNRYGRTEVSRFHPVGTGSYIRSSSGPVLIDLEQIGDGRLAVVNEYEDIELQIPDTISATLALTVDDDGTIDVSQTQFAADLVEHNHLNLRLRQGVGSISASVRGKGNILVRGKSGE